VATLGVLVQPDLCGIRSWSLLNDHLALYPSP